MSVRVRFAPSPTGPLHMGGVRTALYNYLFAKKNKGVFILRIEDTDEKRYVPGAEDYIFSALKWCGIEPDESVNHGGDFGPYRQSNRKDIYQEYAQKLIANGSAYYAFDTPEELDAQRQIAKENGIHTWQYDHSTRGSMRNSLSLSEDETQSLINEGVDYVLRFKINPDQEIKFIDEIRGEVNYNSNVLDDKVIFKSSGMPTYHLANIVDDHLMEITHVIRGEEWLPSAPLHVLLYKAFGWQDTMPKFAHLPLILKPTGNGKLSKRDGDKLGFPVFPLEWKDPKSGDIASGYKEQGYFSESFINMLLMLGWNPGTEQELFSHEDMISQFSLERVIKSGARFSPEKAQWFNEQYLRSKPINELAKAANSLLKDKGIEFTTEQAEKMCMMMVERSSFVQDLVSADFLYQRPTEYDAKTLKKKWKEDSPQIISELKDKFAALEPFNEETVDAAFQEFMAEKELGFGRVAPALRLVTSGKGGGPSIPAILDLLGKEETIARMEKGLSDLA